MSKFESLTRPNDFMLGYRPFTPVVYDETLTPLEMLNKLAYKLNQIVASDTNVKDNVDKLLGVWKDAFMAKAGYIAPLETVYSENILNPSMDLSGVEIFKKKDSKNWYIIKSEDRYKAIHLHMHENRLINWQIFKKIDGEWVEFYNVEKAQNLDVDIYLATTGNDWEYRIKAQDEKYTLERYFKLSWSYDESEET